MPKRTLKTWVVFHNARKYLDRGTIQGIFTQTSRHFDRWAADPKYCAETARNPLDRLGMLLTALDDAGKCDVARAAVDWLAGLISGRFTDAETAKSLTGDMNAEAADIPEALGDMSRIVRRAQADGVVDPAERIRIKEARRKLNREIDEFLDAAGVE